MQKEISENPEWLDGLFLKRVIQSYKNDETIDIENYEIESGFAEHYASRMYRSKIDFKSKKFQNQGTETMNVVIKASLVNDPKVEMVVAGGPLFETEMEIYQKVIPAMKQLYQRNGIKVDFAPELIYTTTEPCPIIILKDLTPEDYRVSRKAPKNVNDSKKFVTRLAQFHAASMYLAESNEVDVTKFNYSIYNSEHILDFFFRGPIKVFKEVVAEWGGYDEYLPKIEALVENIGKIGRQSYTANSKAKGFNVLNHGDLHLRNILIKFNAEQQIDNFYFIDYQLCVWCSPVVDLSYLMGITNIEHTSSDADAKAELILFYHKELENALKSIGYMGNPPSLLDINMELLKHGAMNIAIWINFFPFLFIDWNNMNADDLMGNDSERSRNFRKEMYNTPVLKELVQKEMKEWMLKGWW